MKIKKVAIIPNAEKKSAISEISGIAELIKKNEIQVLIEDRYKDSKISAEFVPFEKLRESDMIVALGGDGTMLSVVRDFIESDILFLGINYGNLGFLTEIEKDNISELEKILNGEFITEEHLSLKVGDGDTAVSAINEVVINRGDFSRIIEFDLFIDNRQVASYFADGLIISTPTGSTAYSLSAGGPISDPELEVMIVTPICPHDLHSRSIILPATKEVKVMPKNESFVTVDGYFYRTADENNALTVRAGEKIKFARRPNSSFYNRLRKKIYERR